MLADIAGMEMLVVLAAFWNASASYIVNSCPEWR